MEAFRPTSAAEVKEVVGYAAAESQPLEIVAGGSKRALGRPVMAARRLDLSGLAGIVDYDPAELVLTARAATPMAEIAAQLDAQGQMLAFEPPDWAALLGGEGAPTLGGVIACNLAGPRRVRAGAARDHLLGFSAVNGWGDGWKAGGKVVKNVTGYDLSKLQAGAFGTLSVLLELSVRVLPRPETSCSVVLPGADDGAAVRALADAMNSVHEVAAAAHLPRRAAARSGVPEVAALNGAAIARLEGHAPSVAFRAGALAAAWGAASILPRHDSVRLWQEVAAVQPLLPDRESLVWRVCVTPSEAPAVMRAASSAFPSADGFYDWGGGLLWLSLDLEEAGADAGATVVRGAVARAGGHATLLRAPEEVRARVPVFEPAPAPLAALSRRVKAGFDPQAVLNPGRMHEGV